MGSTEYTPIAAAVKCVEQYFPDCRAAFLAGSVVRNEATARSDLDIVVIDDTQESPFRMAMHAFGWPIEVFVMTSETYEAFFEINRQSAIPSLQRMCAQGVLIKDNGTAAEIIKAAKESLDRGPLPWTPEEIDEKRYVITEYVEDLIGSRSRGENLFSANRLAQLLHEFILRVNGKWIGDGKWVVRSLRQYDPALCDDFVGAFDAFYRNGEIEPIVQLVDQVLAPHGGRLFAGFRQESGFI